MSDESEEFCPKCPGKKIANKGSLKQHSYEYHCNKCTISVSDEDQTTKITITRVNSVLHCPACKESFSSRRNLKTHLNKSKCKKTLFVETTEQNHITKRDYDSAVLNACGGIQFEKNHQQILKIIDAAHLKPLCLIDNKGEEHNVLVTEEHIHKICDNYIISIQPVKKKKKEKERKKHQLNKAYKNLA
ncbi:hypothetical protein RMCBS344292_01108 [Rhizopus microsporus]|nr:hypothetical protein RMCBS344292_01108 [Rhizopus microsporus]